MPEPAPTAPEPEKPTAPEPEKPTEPKKPTTKEDKAEDRGVVERRFVARSVNAFVRWMPLGGSGGLFLSFILKQEWALTLLAFPVTAVTAVWAAYSESFVTRLQEIYKERGTKDADALVKGMDSLNQAVSWQLAGFEEKYLKCQAESCRDYRVEGFQPQGVFVTQLEEVFVPLRLSGESLQRGLQGPMGKKLKGKAAEKAAMKVMQEAQKPLQVWDLLREIQRMPAYKSMAILAWGGSGKTTLLRNIAFVYAKKLHGKYRAPKLVPVLLYLRVWRDEIAKETPPTLSELIQMHMRSLPGGKQLSPPPNWAERMLRCGEALVMIDGFDEVAEGQRDAVSEWINQQMRDYPQSVFMLTSRPGGYEHYSAERPQTQLTVQGFNQEQRQKFMEQWYLCQERYARGGRETPDVLQTAQEQAGLLIEQIEAREELQQMASNPLLLNMIATFHRSYPDIELPQQRGDLYQEICKLQLGARPLAKKIRLLLTAEKAQLVLQGLALAMVQRNEASMGRTDVVALLEATLSQMQLDVSAAELLKQLVEVSELLVAEKSSEALEFSHLSFQGYLAAAEIKRLNQGALLLDHVADSWWRETSLLYAAQLDRPTSFIRSIYALGTSDAVRLAQACWRETAHKTEPDLNLEIRKQGYQVLEQQLQAGQWREADQETYRLMITTVGKEEGQWFGSQDLTEFPCEDLRLLDGLWVKYSDGRFGFSVQKKIWQDCGSPGPYNDKTAAQWEQFGDRVGWRKDGQWLNYSNLALHSTGELPLPWRNGPGQARWEYPLCGAGWLGSSLASRLVNCKL